MQRTTSGDGCSRRQRCARRGRRLAPARDALLRGGARVEGSGGRLSGGDMLGRPGGEVHERWTEGPGPRASERDARWRTGMAGK